MQWIGLYILVAIVFVRLITRGAAESERLHQLEMKKAREKKKKAGQCFR